MAKSAFDEDGGGIRPDRPYRLGTEPDPDEMLEAGVEAGVEAPRGPIGSLMQKLFFRDQYEKEQILLDLMEDLGQRRTLEEVARYTLDALDQALRPEAIHLFVRRAARFRLLRSTERPDEGKVLLPADFVMPEAAAGWHEPRQAGALGDLSHDERAWLRAWRVRWIVPVAHPRADGLVGLLLLGQRTGGYSTVQRDLLQALASRLALEIHRHHEERIDRLRLDRGQGGWLLECPACGRCVDEDTFFCPDDDSTIEPTLLVDRDVAGRYRLVRRLGRGGMGAVYRAIDLQADSDSTSDGTSSDVAVKLLTGGDPITLGRFTNEMRAGQRIRHPAVVQFIDSGTIGRYGAYLVMEFVVGRTLRQILEADGPWDPRTFAPWFDEVLGGVAAAHAEGIVHRDLKPENLMRVERDEESPASDSGSARILDFGLAKLHHSDSGPQHALTGVGMVVGTLAYMSPEQLQADTLDHRSDLFTLGVLAAEALTGELPFRADNLGEMIQAVSQEPFRMHVTCGEQARVADVLGHALEKDPERRYPDVETFRRELIPALEVCPPFTRPG